MKDTVNKLEKKLEHFEEKRQHEVIDKTKQKPHKNTLQDTKLFTNILQKTLYKPDIPTENT